MRLNHALRPLLLAAALLGTARAAVAQRYWHDEQGRSAFRADFGLPFLKDSLSPGKKFYSGSMVGSFSLRVGDGFRVEGDVPVMRAGYDYGTTLGTQSSIRLGNPFIGLRVGDDEKLVSGILGVRLPVNGRATTDIGRRAVAAGMVSNYDEYEAFASKNMTIRTGLEVHSVKKNGMMVGVRGGPSILINTSNDPKAESEILFDYGARIGIERPGALATLALTGRYLMTAPAYDFSCTGEAFPATCDPKSFDSRTHHAVTGMVELRPGAIRPRIALRFPLDKGIRSYAGATVQVGVSIAK